MPLELLAAWLSENPDGLSDYPLPNGRDVYGPPLPPRPVRARPAFPPAAVHREVRAADVIGRLKEIPREQGGAKAKKGPAPKGVVGESPRFSERTRDEAAEKLGVTPDYARAVETVFTTPGVPESLKAAVNSGKVAPTTAKARLSTYAEKVRAFHAEHVTKREATPVQTELFASGGSR